MVKNNKGNVFKTNQAVSMIEVLLNGFNYLSVPGKDQ
jgi:hypothetical protein